MLFIPSQFSNRLGLSPEFINRPCFLVHCSGFRQGEDPRVRTKGRCEKRAGFLAPGDKSEWRANTSDGLHVGAPDKERRIQVIRRH